MPRSSGNLTVLSPWQPLRQGRKKDLIPDVWTLQSGLVIDRLWPQKTYILVLPMPLSHFWNHFPLEMRVFPRLRVPPDCQTPTHCSIQDLNVTLTQFSFAYSSLSSWQPATPTVFTHQSKCTALGSLVVKPSKNPIRTPLMTAKRRMMKKFGLDAVPL